MSRLREIKRTIKTLEKEGEPSPVDERFEYHTRLRDLYLESSKIHLARAEIGWKVSIAFLVVAFVAQVIALVARLAA